MLIYQQSRRQTMHMSACLTETVCFCSVQVTPGKLQSIDSMSVRLKPAHRKAVQADIDFLRADHDQQSLRLVSHQAFLPTESHVYRVNLAHWLLAVADIASC